MDELYQKFLEENGGADPFAEEAKRLEQELLPDKKRLLALRVLRNGFAFKAGIADLMTRIASATSLSELEVVASELDAAIDAAVDAALGVQPQQGTTPTQ